VSDEVTVMVASLSDVLAGFWEEPANGDIFFKKM